MVIKNRDNKSSEKTRNNEIEGHRRLGLRPLWKFLKGNFFACNVGLPVAVSGFVGRRRFRPGPFLPCLVCMAVSSSSPWSSSGVPGEFANLGERPWSGWWSSKGPDESASPTPLPHSLLLTLHYSHTWSTSQHAA